MSAPRRVFITGARGFIGAALAEHYRGLGAEVRGVDLKADPAAGIVAGDVGHPGPWQAHAAGCDLVIHTAAVVSMRADHDGSVWQLNVMGTRLALDAARDGGAERFVQLSSVTAFSFDFPDGVDETHPLRPNGVPYVDTKIASEQAVLQAHGAGEVECTIVRPGDVYGPRSQPWVVLPLELLRERRFVLPARGRGVFSPTYIDDLVDGIATAAGSPAGAGQVFTLTGGADVTTGEFFGFHARLLGQRGVPSLPTPLALAAAVGVGTVSRLAGTPSEANAGAVRYLARTGGYSIARARERLGWSPRVGLEEGLAETERWVRASGLLEGRPAAA